MIRCKQRQQEQVDDAQQLNAVLDTARSDAYRNGGFGAVPASSEAIEGLQETTVGEAKEAKCAVCLEDFEAADKLRRMPCFHVFHEGRIFDWLRVTAVSARSASPVAHSTAIVAAERGWFL